jgi:hypothetical protein
MPSQDPKVMAEIIAEIESALASISTWKTYALPSTTAHRSFIGSHDGWLFTVLDYTVCSWNDEDFQPEHMFDGVVINKNKSIMLHLPYPVARRAVEAALQQIGTN